MFLGLISFSNLASSNNTFASYTPTLSASVDQANLQVNGNQVINSTDKTTEIPLNLTVNTNNKTGYTATLSSETENTALINATSTAGAKINSIDTNKILTNFSQNTWGYKVGSATNYSPIPALSAPSQVLKTTGKTNGNETNSLKLGMKLGETLESGSYTNKLIFSILTNNYNRIAIMTEGPDFNTKLKSLETATNKIEHFKKSTVAPAASMNAVNIDDEESDYEIKLWFNPTDKTAYYYTEPEKVYLNTNSSSMFLFKYDNKDPLEIDVSNFDTSKVTDMSHMFTGMDKLTSLNLSNFNTSKVTNMDSMFEDMHSLTSLDLSNVDTSKVTDMQWMFHHLSNLTTLNLSNFNTSKVTNMSGMFSSMSNLTTLNLSNFNTSQVTSMYGMFSDMRKLSALNLSNFDTSKVTNMSGMFSSMSNLTTLNLSNFNTSQVTGMSYMFYGTSGLTMLNLSNFDTSKVKDMSYMFYSVGRLTTLNLSNFNTSKVTNMHSMFDGMYSLTSLDLSNFDTSQVTDMGYMFSLDYDYNDKLEKIYVNNDFNTSKLTNFTGMFRNRKKLRGGNGSYLADPSTADKTWLRVDRPGVHGYLTRKP